MKAEYIKNYNDWNFKKQKLNAGQDFLHYKEGDIWWSSLGVNVGYEIDGKHQHFERPVLVLKKITRSQAFIVPLTSAIRPDDNRFVIYEIGGRKRSANVSQARMIDVRRFRRKHKDKLPIETFRAIKEKFLSQFQ